MNILIAAAYAAPSSGNFIASLLELGSVLRTQGDDIIFVFPKCENALKENSWYHWLISHQFIVYLTDRTTSNKQQLAELQNIIKQHNIQVLHTHFGMYHHLITHCRRALPLKIVVHDHGDFSFEKNLTYQKIINLLQSVRYRLLNINVISVNPKRDISYRYTKHWYIPNGISLNRHLISSRSREQCRSELGIMPEEKLCLFLGWALHLKGLDVALKAISECRKQDPSIILGVVGVGTPPKERTLKYIQEHTDIDPLSPWIHYLPDTEDMFAYHRSADTYLSASRSEGFSYGVLESISQNTPVVVSDIYGTQWAHEFNHTFPYPVEDYHACANAIQKALSIGRSESNSTEIIRKYGIQKWCQDIINIYKSI